MKLYNIKNGSPLRIRVNGKTQNATFNHIDGMYSHCETESGDVFHLEACTPIKKVEGRYEIKK